MPLNLLVGDVITTKKNHPCGSYDFEIMRAGMDFRIKCKGCDKQIWIERRNLEKRVKKVHRDGEVLTKDKLDLNTMK
jgi:hypothetical protein